MTAASLITARAGSEETFAPAQPLRAGAALDAEAFYEVRRRAVLEGCKWDPQVRDTPTLAPFPLLMRGAEWRPLAAWAEQLTREVFEAEREIIEQRPALLRRLGLPRMVRRALECAARPTPAAARVIRFDFHFTIEGWRISEANSDVPGGYSEASFFTELMAEHFSDARPTGHPASTLCDALAASARHAFSPLRGEGGSRSTALDLSLHSKIVEDKKTPLIALLAAPGYMEDQQIVAYLARLLGQRGCAARLATPEQLRWRDGRAGIVMSSEFKELSAVLRFYQGEWLARLPSRCGWQNLFRAGLTPVANPGVSVITESKRFPLLWDELSTPMTAWRELLPETRDPREVPWQTDDSWLLKSAMCNNGDTVGCREVMEAARWRRFVREVRWFPGGWIAQRRFQSLPLDTPLGVMSPCVGVYTVNGRASGAYVRLARSPVVNYEAMDVALLLEGE